MSLSANNRARRPNRQRGFTLIEAAMTTVIVGVGFMAMLQLMATGTRSNGDNVEHTTALNLAKNVRELTLKTKYAQLLALNNSNYKPVVDSQGKQLAGLDDWTQTLVVHAVDPNRLTLDIADPTPEAMRCTVQVKRNGKPVTAVTWYCFEGVAP